MQAFSKIMTKPVTPKNILIVDDGTELSAALKCELSKCFEIHTVDNGNEAIVVLENNAVDAIVCNADDGLELCRKVKNSRSHSHVPFILYPSGGVSSRENMRDKVQTNSEKQDREFIEKIDSLIEAQISNESFSIDTIARQMCMSKSNFYRKFHSISGTSPNEYLKNYRLEKAAQMIQDGTRINEAAMAMGYSSASYFAKCFLAKFGVLPKDYLESLRNSEELLCS